MTEYSTISNGDKKPSKSVKKTAAFKPVFTDSTEYVYTTDKINAGGRNVRDPACYGGIEPGTTKIYYDGDTPRIIVEHQIRKIPIKPISDLKG